MKNTEGMVLELVKFYQGVKVGSDTHSSIAIGSAIRDQRDGDNPLPAELIEEEHGVLIKYGNKAVLATWNNVQYAQFVPSKANKDKKDLATALAKQSK
jgi:hypothetical protein